MPAAYETADDEGDFAPISNPLPPPPRPGDSKPPAEEERPLSNDDFRRMVAETPRRGEDKAGKHKNQRRTSGDGEKPKKKWQPKPKEGEETGAGTGSAYRDRAKERREDQNPDYDGASAELGGLHAVPAPGTFSDIHTSDAHKISIENSKYLGGDVEHTHLVKGLDYALLQKVRSELKKSLEEQEEDEDDAKARAKEHRRKEAEEKAMNIRTGVAKSVYQWLIKPTRSNLRASEMFLPGRTSFLFELDDEFAADIPTTLHRSKADCPAPQDLLDASVDALLLDRISRVMSYLRLGSSAKGLKKLKKRDRDLVRPTGVAELRASARDSEEPSPRTDTNNHAKPPKPSLADDDDIFEDAGREYTLEVPEKGGSAKGGEGQENGDRGSYFAEPGKPAPQPEEALLPPPPPPPDAGAVPPQYGDHGPQAPPGGYDGMAYPEVGQGYYQGYPPAEMYPQPADYQYGPVPGAAYPPQGDGYGYEAYPEAPPVPVEDLGPQPLTQADKDKGAASVFRRDDASLRQRDRDEREKDPGFVSDTYAECYPGYGEYNHEVLEGSCEQGEMGQ